MPVAMGFAFLMGCPPRPAIHGRVVSVTDRAANIPLRTFPHFWGNPRQIPGFVGLFAIVVAFGRLLGGRAMRWAGRVKL